MAIQTQIFDNLQKKAEKDGYKCVVGGLVLREFEDGQRAIYAQKRTANRKLFPSCWDILGGHVDEGESLDQALAREIIEESGWELTTIIKHLKTVQWKNNEGESIQEFVFLITVAGNLDSPKIETEKFSEFRWILESEIDILKENRQDGEQLIFELASLAFAQTHDLNPESYPELNPELNPWTTLSSELIYENSWLSFREDKVINPAGGEGIYGVASPKTIGVSTIPIDQDGNIWLVEQYRYPLEKYTWEICSGGAEPTESLVVAAQRELLEETGITAKKWTELAQIDVSNSVTDAIGMIFVAQDLSFSNTKNDVTEDIRVKKIAFDEALGMLEPSNNQNDQTSQNSPTSSISDVTSVVGLLKLALQRDTYGV